MLIKLNKRIFESVDANTIVLHQVKVPEDKYLVDNANKQLNTQTALMMTTTNIRDLFLGPPKGRTVHILVLPLDTREPLGMGPTLASLTPKGSIEPLYDTVRAKLGDYIEGFCPKIKAFLMQEHLPPWLLLNSTNKQTQLFYNELSIPMVNDRPSLLLHNLQEHPNPNGEMLFGGKHHRILCNASSTGKTQLLFEGLSQNWGFS
jgi:hypothetical protein